MNDTEWFTDVPGHRSMTEPTWRELERERQQSGVPIFRVSWTCHHHQPPAIPLPDDNAGVPEINKRRPGKCLDCQVAININSHRCNACLGRYRRHTNYVISLSQQVNP